MRRRSRQKRWKQTLETDAGDRRWKQRQLFCAPRGSKTFFVYIWTLDPIVFVREVSLLDFHVQQEIFF